MYGDSQRGEDRDYIPRRQRVERGQGASLEDGVSMRVESDRRRAHYRKRTDKGREEGTMIDLIVGDW